jgi:hypothetical protein
MIKDYTSEETKELVREATPEEVRAKLEEKYGKDNVFSTDEATEKFNFVGFGAPFVAVVRKSDGASGTLEFNHRPRFYFDFRSK